MFDMSSWYQLHCSDCLKTTQSTEGYDESQFILEERPPKGTILQQPQKGTGIIFTAFNLSNYIIGAGVLAIPYGLKKAGFGLGLILLAVTALSSAYTVILLMKAGTISGTDTYQDTSKAAFGAPGFIIVGVLQFLGALTSAVAYNIVIGDFLSKLMGIVTHISQIDELRSHFWGSRPFLIAAPLLLITFPLMLFKDIGYLSKWALASYITVCVTLIMMFVRLGTLNIPPTDHAYLFASSSFSQAIGTFGLAFMCHDSVFLYYNSLDKPSPTRWKSTVYITMVSTAVLMATMGIVGYVTFTNNVQGDILENYCRKDTLINVGRLLYTFNIIMSIVTGVFVARSVLIRTFFADSKINPFLLHVLMGVLFMGLAYGTSLITECLGIVTAIGGLLACVPLMFIIPPMLMFKLQNEPLCSLSNIPLWTVAGYGIIVLFFGLISILYELSLHGVQCYEGREPAYCWNENSSWIMAPEQFDNMFTTMHQ